MAVPAGTAQAAGLARTATRHLLIGFAVHGIALGRWSQKLLFEATSSLARKDRGDSLADLVSWIESGDPIVRGGLVEDYDEWLDRVSLPDPDDRHVLAAAIACGATIIVTDNIKDFPEASLAPCGITAVKPDDFAIACIGANPVLAVRVVAEHPDPTRFLENLDTQLPTAAALLRDLFH